MIEESERPAAEEVDEDSDELTLDPEEAEDLEQVMKDALEAVDAVEKKRDDVRPVAPVAPVEPVVPAAQEASADDGAETTEAGVLLAELEAARERSVRTLADFDNYRKRVEREHESQRRYDGFDVLRGLLDVLDNLERALDADGPAEDLKAGVELTLRQMEDLLRRHSVEKIEAADAAFDPALHEAVSRHEEADLDEPMVSMVLQDGYTMRDRLLRPVRVSVAVPAERTRQPEDAENGLDGGESGDEREE